MYAATARLRASGTAFEFAEDAGRPADLGDQLLLLANGAMVTAAMLHDPTFAFHAKQAAEHLLNAPI